MSQPTDFRALAENAPPELAAWFREAADRIEALEADLTKTTIVAEGFMSSSARHAAERDAALAKVTELEANCEMAMEQVQRSGHRFFDVAAQRDAALARANEAEAEMMRSAREDGTGPITRLGPFDISGSGATSRSRPPKFMLKPSEYKQFGY